MAIIKNYEQAAKLFATARAPAKGKPLKKWCRLYKDGADFTVDLSYGHQEGRTTLCRITPDHVVTFEPTLEEMWEWRMTVTTSLYKVMPVHALRVKKKLYRIGSDQDFEAQISRQNYTRSYWNHQGHKWMREAAPAYFAGIKFNLLTGECLNGVPDPSQQVLPKNRRVWLRELKRFKRGLHTRVKMGVVDKLIAEEAAFYNATPTWTERNARVPDWSTTEARQLLVHCMQKQNYPEELLRYFVRTNHVAWGSPGMTRQTVSLAIDKVFRTESEALRREYGVFKE